MTSLSLKPGVSVKGMRPQIMLAISAVHALFDERGYSCTITSCTDGEHSRGSLHYVGLAADFRTRHIHDASELAQMTDILRARLGDEYDVVLEPTHLHIEYQPKE